jgi:hypothetical protein
MGNKQITVCFQFATATGAMYNAYLDNKFALAMDIEASNRTAELKTAARMATRRILGATAMGSLKKLCEAADRPGHYVWAVA